jgi:hypothetical protein
LVHRLRNGFPIGNFSPLLDTYIHPNHGSFREHEPSILKYILEEVSLGHMSGPFSESELRREFGQQHVISSPLGAVDKAGEPGKIRVIRDLSHRGKAPHSVNDEVNADEETTKWGKASDMAEVVSPFFLLILSPRSRSDLHLSPSGLSHRRRRSVTEVRCRRHVRSQSVQGFDTSPVSSAVQYLTSSFPLRLLQHRREPKLLLSTSQLLTEPSQYFRTISVSSCAVTMEISSWTTTCLSV